MAMPEGAIMKILFVLLACVCLVGCSAKNINKVKRVRDVYDNVTSEGVQDVVNEKVDKIVDDVKDIVNEIKVELEK